MNIFSIFATGVTFLTVFGSLSSAQYEPRGHLYAHDPSLILNNLIIHLPDVTHSGLLGIVFVHDIVCENATLSHIHSDTHGNNVDVSLTGLGVTCGGLYDVGMGTTFLFHNLSTSFLIQDSQAQLDLEVDSDNLEAHTESCKLEVKVTGMHFELKNEFIDKIVTAFTPFIEKLIQSSTGAICNELKPKIDSVISTKLNDLDVMLKPFYNLPDPAAVPSIRPGEELVNFADSEWLRLIQYFLGKIKVSDIDDYITLLTDKEGSLSVPEHFLKLFHAPFNLANLLNITLRLDTLKIDGLNSFSNLQLIERIPSENHTLRSSFGMDGFDIQSRVSFDVVMLPNPQSHSHIPLPTLKTQVFDLNFTLDHLDSHIDLFLGLDNVQAQKILDTKYFAPGCAADTVTNVKALDLIFDVHYPSQVFNVSPVSGDRVEPDLAHLIDSLVLLSSDVFADKIPHAIRGIVGSLLRDKINKLEEVAFEKIHNMTPSCNFDDQDKSQITHAHLSNGGKIGVAACCIALFIFVLVMSFLQYNYYHGKIFLPQVLMLDQEEEKNETTPLLVGNGNNGHLADEDDHGEEDEHQDGTSGKIREGSISDIASSGDTRRHNPDFIFGNSCNSLASHYSRSRWDICLHVMVPTFIFCTFGFRLFSLLADVCTIHADIHMDGKPLFRDELIVFTFTQLVHDFWKSKAYLISCLIVLGSCILPVVKHVIMIICWWCPLKPRVRGHLLFLMDQLGKASFVDVIFLSFIVNVFRNQITDGPFHLDVIATPAMGVYIGMTSTLLNTLTGQFMMHLHNQRLRAECNVILLTQGLHARPEPELPTTKGKRFGIFSFWVLYIFMFFLGSACYIIGYLDTFISFQISGFVQHALPADTLNTTYSLLEIVNALPTHTDDVTGAEYITVLFYLLTIVMPAIFFFFILLNMVFRPLFYKHFPIFFEYFQDVTYCVAAYSGLEVLWIASLATQLEINEIAVFASKKNTGKLCDYVEEYMGEQCLTVQAEMGPSAWFMFVGGFVSVFLVLSFSHHDWKLFSNPLPFPRRSN